MIRFVHVVLLLAAVIAGGTIGFHIIEGWSISESLYMTFITATTVGFGEVRPLSTAGRVFTIGLLVMSIATVGYSVSIIFSYIFEGQIFRALKERRMARAISRMKDHYIICGYGDVGKAVASEFQRQKVSFVVIDRNPDEIKVVLEADVPCILGDASDDEVLIEASIERAAGLISTFPDDESNVFIALSARQLNPGLTIVSQARDERSTGKLRKAGANRVISTPSIAGQRMAAIVMRPSVTQFLDVVMRSDDLDMRIEEIPIGAGSPMIGKTLKETGIGGHTGALVIGITKPGGRTSVNASETATLSSTVLGEQDVLIALGSADQLVRLADFVGSPKTQPLKRLFGGSS
jgi:voltage-gated potassium channel